MRWYLPAFALLMSLLIYPALCARTWNPSGWLKTMGFVDLAGGGGLHAIGAWCSLAGLLVLGPRLGHFGRNGECETFPGTTCHDGGARRPSCGWAGSASTAAAIGGLEGGQARHSAAVDLPGRLRGRSARWPSCA